LTTLGPDIVLRYLVVFMMWSVRRYYDSPPSVFSQPQVPYACGMPTTLPFPFVIPFSNEAAEPK
jgi:hypothetical protein